MTEIASRLSNLGYTLYSGGADGADHAFEIGTSNKLIFLPWDGFCGKNVDSNQYIVPPFNGDLVNKYHPRASKLKPGALRLMSRNSYQVLGPDLRSPVDFILCWTKDGKASGGTGQAIRIANSIGIPVFNMKNNGWKAELLRHVLMWSDQ